MIVHDDTVMIRSECCQPATDRQGSMRTRNPAQTRQQDVDQQLAAAALLHEYSHRWKNEGHDGRATVFGPHTEKARMSCRQLYCATWKDATQRGADDVFEFFYTLLHT